MKLLNLGCGSVFHPDWENLDIVSSFPEVREYDIRRNLPYPDAQFDACYSSHVIEHFNQAEAESFLAECWRILKPKGVVRIVVPDLEFIVRDYIKALEQVNHDIKEAEPNYDWMMLELYDQTVRSLSGGVMKDFLFNPKIINKDFVSYRIGAEAENYWNVLPNGQSTRRKITSKTIWQVVNKVRIMTAKFLVFAVAGNEAMKAFEEGVFRNSGEIHRWMYDRYSLKRLLQNSGFSDIQVCQATESRISDFNSYKLDVINGKTRKPDSLFMEAIKQ
jgi:predicted SAM-dependent methyltransferase